MKSIVLGSGGMDSTVTTAIAVAESEDVALLHVNYGQRTEKRELNAFEAIADHYGISKKLIVDIRYLAEIGGSSLTDRAIPVEKNQLNESDIPTSYVPFRNANILAIAVSWAEVIQADRIYIGAVEADSSGYPDCREAFFAAFDRVIATGSRPDLTTHVHTPLIRLSKSAIVKKAAKISAPVHLSWSCYERSDTACGECDSCLLRIHGFKEAGFKDPIPYQIDIDWPSDGTTFPVPYSNA